MKVSVSFRTAILAITTGTLAACASAGGAASQQPASVQIAVPQIHHPDGQSAQWWFREGAAEAASRGAMRGHAKNLILFVGDGMSLATVAAARIYEGQLQGQSGEEHRLAWENFPDTALSRTYNTDYQTPDSAGTMSAMATGAKTRMGVLSIGQQAARNNCKAALGAQLLTLWELAASSGMATGVVTTTRVTHATPGATFSHSANRNWENDTDLPAAAREAGCIDIARQMVESPFGNGPDVLMGGGRREFMPNTTHDPEYPDQAGSRGDGRDLISEWQARHPGGEYVWNTTQLQSASNDGALLGLFEPDHMHFEHDRPTDGAGEPSLKEMTQAAIARLSKNANGYVLLVEGGRIDHANHYGNAYRALTDTIALSDAVRAATEATSADDTLILVTADHSHTLTFVGYPARGNPILGKVRGIGEEDAGDSEYALDGTGKPFTTLVYANGPGNTGASDSQPAGPKTFPHRGKGYKPVQGRPDLTNVDTTAPDYMQESLVPLGNESHGGDDVGIWAIGPGSDAVRGSVEENAVFHFLLQATPRLRAALCAKGDCDPNGVPAVLPTPGDFEGSGK
ncbi:alkaline phosphatase [Pseudoluteimonas lycopersici]|uniref:Alkaline phosphatase n=1 Tax=Pseudoluteimonas lycopersici TaxID=1324796 RepID=A0A516V1T1_9GAMM|nr:alkaline phosphatase [Lysobacter lycopersici]QDQ72479.1 alkaline phosphatase [Lysobacter lycopersici]